ncbi:hypothetical protein [Actinacidiphila glaucinigra]|uniref:hypothetical protein n=1 Tax=Actinacidiphila glaucinigra TaxID=235986 RepID=UPI002E2F2011|nr:hypothetical protein [Actinacidiphila glaucinigra]
MAARPILDVTVSADGIRALGDALKREADGKELRKELARNLREVLKPAAAEAKSAIMSMPSAGTRQGGPGLRSMVARKIRPEVKLGGRWSGARVKAFKTPGLRGFANAPKRLNRPRGWRHLTYGREPWVTQHGKDHWFDRAMDGQQAAAREAVHEAMEAMARRIADRAGQG